MRKILMVVMGVVFFGPQGLAQTQTRTSPDCILAFSFTATGTSGDLNNIVQTATGQSTGGCSVWVITAEAFNSGAGTVTFQAAESNVAGTGPSSYSTFAGTTVSGSNPASSFPSTFVATGFNAWLRISAAISAGTLRGSVQGWRQQTGTSGGSGGGGTITNLGVCANSLNTVKSAPINFTSAATSTVIAASGSTSITLCSLSLSSTATTNIALLYGTTAACAAGTTQLSGSNGGYQQVLTMALDNMNLTLPASQSFCMTSSAAATIGGIAFFIQQ